MNTKIPIANLDEKDASLIASSLNKLLANEYAFFTKLLNFHWNVTGPRFNSLHNFFEESYTDQLTLMDEVAERIRFLGESPRSTVSEMKSGMDLKEMNGKNLSSTDMISELFEDSYKLQVFIKDTLVEKDLFKNDPGTEDFLVGVLQKHEMLSWKLNSYLS